MLEISRERKIYKGEFINKETLAKYKMVIQESGGQIKREIGPGAEVAALEGSIILEDGEYFVGMTFEREENYNAFKERVNTPQVVNG
ncbi:MAG: hypothetical protein A3B38_04080 [Candidatus Levybacteria bacterium RIFCSPLOWO2_01_FULL_36_13]|nr:MAG: hypothetical protein A3B38_04080 [Candidatus Levybacteria bacterium RIFCSPLOWO2_01_FULL_36_13]